MKTKNKTDSSFLSLAERRMKERYYNMTSFLNDSKGWKDAFTLVELIIVITILAILATIAFMSFQGYMKDSRDVVRISDLTNASKWLSIFYTKSGIYPEPESGVFITASWNIIGSQWSLWKSVVRVINMNQVPLDPVDQSTYVYSVNGTKNKFQLMAYAEWSSLVSIVPNTYAEDYSQRGMVFQWDEVWVFTNADNSLPTGNIETVSGSTLYKVAFDKNTSLQWSGNVLYSKIYNMREDLLRDKSKAIYDRSLVWYWDMETLSWGNLHDFSSYINEGRYFSCNVICTSTASQVYVEDGKSVLKLTNSNNSTYYLVRTPITQLSQFTVHVRSQILDLSRTYWWVVWKYTYVPWGWSWFFLRYWWSLQQYQTCVAWSGQYICINSSTIQPNMRNDLAITYDGSNLKLYQDGKNLWSVRAWLEDNGLQLTLWATYMGWETVSSLLDDVRVYNRALSESEIQMLYKASK